MASYSIATTKDKLSALIERACAGEEVVITSRGKPVARLGPVETGDHNSLRVATEQLRLSIKGQKSLNIPTERFRDWLYEDYDF